MLTGGGDASESAAVKGLVEGDDFGASLPTNRVGCVVAETTGEFNEAVIGFGTGVCEKGFAGNLD